MDEFEALKLIGESGLVAEKMTDEERAAKRKARRDARKAEEQAYRDQHWKFKCNRITGSGCFPMIYDLCKSMKGEVPEFDLFSGDDYGDEYVHVSWSKIDSNGKRHNSYLRFDIKQVKFKKILCDIVVDGTDEDVFSYKDPEAESGIFTSGSLHWESRDNGYEFDVIINKEAFTDWFKKISAKAIEALDRVVNFADEEGKKEEDRKIPDFKYLEFEFTDDPIDAMTGESHRYRVPKEFAMNFFKENCGSDNDSYKDFKDLFDSLDITYMRSMEDRGSLIRRGFTFSQYKWFKRGGGDLKGSLWSFPAFKGYENDNVDVKGWKLS